jgi:glycosyltransferase involved in cell wall biosynthesis
VLNQTYNNIEYIIIDGCSNDKTVDVIKSYKNEFLNKGIEYKLFLEPANGMYHALNKGIKIASGLIIGSINSDDWYEPNAVEIVVNTYRETKFDMFYADLRIIKSTGNIIKHSKKRDVISSRYWNHPTTFITREIYSQYQYKMKSLYDDFDLMIRIRRNSHNVVIRNVVIANFRFGGMSTEKKIRAVIERIKIRYKIYRDNDLSRFYIFECVLVEFVKYFTA